jgi:DNA-binding LacI/PurR family transcriptional regulator
VIPSLNRWFYSAVVEGAERVLHREGYDAFLIDLETGPHERLRPFSNSLLRKRADAVIALGIDFSSTELKEFRTLEMPAVVVGGPVRGVRSVGIDDVVATRTALAHLFALGHERIAHIGGADEYGMQYSVATVRHDQWLAAMAERGSTPPAAWFGAGGFLLPQARQVALEVLGQADRPTAVFAGSDEMAFGVLLAARELGLRVPEDLSVLGIDDHDWSESFSLTTVRQDARAQGARAARVILDEIAGVPVHGLVLQEDTELVVRGTTAPPAR